MSQLQQFIYKARWSVVLLVGMLLPIVSYILSLGFRFDFDLNEMLTIHRLALPISLLVCYRFAASMYWNLNRSYWRYLSTYDLFTIIKAQAASSLVFAASILLLRIPEFPRSVVALEFALSILLNGGTRLLARSFCEWFFTSGFDVSDALQDVIVIGAGDSGHLVVKNLIGNKKLSYRPVAVLDDSERAQGVSVYGVKVFGTTADLERCLSEFPHVSAVIVAIPSLSPVRYQRIESVCKKLGITCKKLQSFDDILFIDAQTSRSQVSIESVLEKEIDIEHEDEIREAISGRRVLVTGGGGSIGSELVRQILPFNPHTMLVLDNGEYALFKIEREVYAEYPDVKKHFIVANICDEERLSKIFEQFKPEIIFHAAAYKHVPLMEANCYEAFQNNILGTNRLISACHEYQAKRFVLISSDKAVDPTSIMGCSKRIAEMLVRQQASLGDHIGALSDKTPRLNTAVVRFGNVINSNGSVIPLFKDQIQRGGPITVTHPDMERYFMSIREAVRLVLTAGALGESGEIFTLEMGQKIKIVEVAKKMLALYGRRDIPVVFTGIRPGEKLTEDIVGHGEEILATPFRKVNKVEKELPLSLDVMSWVETVKGQLASLSDQDIGRLMREFVSSVDEQESPRRAVGA